MTGKKPINPPTGPDPERTSGGYGATRCLLGCAHGLIKRLRLRYGDPGMEPEQTVLTKNDMRHLDINPVMAQQALEQTRERAQYALDMRHKIELRAATLLRTFLTLALAIVGYAVALGPLGGDGPGPVWPIALGAIPLFVAAACLGGAIWDRPYATLGSASHWWLRDGVIDGDAAEAAYLNACLAESYEKRNVASIQSNDAALRWIRRAMIAAAVTPVTIALAIATL